MPPMQYTSVDGIEKRCFKWRATPHPLASCPIVNYIDLH